MTPRAARCAACAVVMTRGSVASAGEYAADISHGLYGDTSRVMRSVKAPYMYGGMYAGSRDVSDPLGRGRDRSPGRRGGSLTSRLQYQPGFAAGTVRRPVAAATACLLRRMTLHAKQLASPTQPRNHGSIDRSVSPPSPGTRKNTPWVFFPLFFRG
jgi:hypothetical protein